MSFRDFIEDYRKTYEDVRGYEPDTSDLIVDTIQYLIATIGGMLLIGIIVAFVIEVIRESL